MDHFIRGLFTTETWAGLPFRILAIICATLTLPFSGRWFSSMAASGMAVLAERNRDAIIQQHGLQDAKGAHFGVSGFLIDTAKYRLITYNSEDDGIALDMPFSKILDWTVHWSENQNGGEWNHTIKFRTSDDTTPVFSIGPFSSRQDVDSWDQRLANMLTKA